MKTVLAICAHPDDIEFLMAGTMIHLRKAGYELHYMTVANGSCGSNRYDTETLIRMRRQEAMAAAASLGAVFHESVCNDLEIFYTLPLLAKVAAVVREVAPEIVLTHAPSDYMEDHMNACRLAVTAAFVRGMPNFQTDPPRAPVDNQVTVYHAQPHGNRDPLGQVGASRDLRRYDRRHGPEVGGGVEAREPAVVAGGQSAAGLVPAGPARPGRRSRPPVGPLPVRRRLAAALAPGLLRPGGQPVGRGDSGQSADAGVQLVHFRDRADLVLSRRVLSHGSLLLVLLFVVLTFVSWGLYGPVLHEGQHHLGDGVHPSSLRPFICVGLAYFLIAVVVPLVVLRTKEEKGNWTVMGAVWSFLGGAAGALGALGIVLAFKFHGSPVYVMPLVFGLAPVVNTFVTMWLRRRSRRRARCSFPE